ncbi:hypothetical protein V7S43_017410 [Phytophthora oleae]|uniref:DDE-1 domain-containing protein n=1 Tax=Phytophthora oleae TaxID=2107226 RepID=A0ABD3ETD5_9STRA
METAWLMDEIENYIPGTDGGTESDGEPDLEDDVSPTQPAELQQDYTNKMCNDDKAPDQSPTSTTTARQVDVVKVPMPKRRGNSRVTLKQLMQAKLTPGPDRLALYQLLESDVAAVLCA